MKRRKRTSHTSDSTPAVSSPEPDDWFATISILATSKTKPGKLPYTRSTLWKMVKDGSFPAPIQLSPACKGWWWSTVRDWVADHQAHPATPRRYFGAYKRQRNDQLQAEQ